MCLKAVLLTILQYYTTHRNPMGLESKFWNKLGFILILAHFPATWELKIWKFSNFGQNHFSDFETPFLTGLVQPIGYKRTGQNHVHILYVVVRRPYINELSFIIVEFSFHAEKKKFIVWRSENLFSCPRAGKQAVFQLQEWKIDE